MCAYIDEAANSLSVYDEAIREADRHKWIESQKRGQDLGVQAIRDWVNTYWHDYCRFCRLEHIEGKRQWREFGDDSFDNLSRVRIPNDVLFNEIIDRIRSGDENLGIIVWAQCSGEPVERVLEILAVVDVNEARLEPLDVSTVTIS